MASKILGYELSVTLAQDKDCAKVISEHGEEDNFLTIKVEECGGGQFLSIQTDRWAILPFVCRVSFLFLNS